jgi:hypothetical protein
MLFRNRLSLLVIVFASLAPVALAQPSRTPATPLDTNRIVSSFRDKEADMMQLIGRQKPLLAQMESSLLRTQSELAVWDSILRYRDNVPRYRDRAVDDVSTLRQSVETAYTQLKDMNMQWFAHWRNLQAVYTRYGELTAQGRVDEPLKVFLAKFREITYTMESLVLKINDNRVIADFLLNTRLQ